MFNKILIANRGDNGRRAVAPQTDCMAREARTGEFAAGETHV